VVSYNNDGVGCRAIHRHLRQSASASKNHKSLYGVPYLDGSTCDGGVFGGAWISS